jgi:hypothetical protein
VGDIIPEWWAALPGIPSFRGGAGGRDSREPVVPMAAAALLSPAAFSLDGSTPDHAYLWGAEGKNLLSPDRRFAAAQPDARNGGERSVGRRNGTP